MGVGFGRRPLVDPVRFELPRLLAVATVAVVLDGTPPPVVPVSQASAESASTALGTAAPEPAKPGSGHIALAPYSEREQGTARQIGPSSVERW